MPSRSVYSARRGEKSARGSLQCSIFREIHVGYETGGLYRFGVLHPKPLFFCANAVRFSMQVKVRRNRGVLLLKINP